MPPAGKLQYHDHLLTRRVKELESSSWLTKCHAGAKNTTLLRVVIPTALVLLLCNIDRICMSVAILPLAKEMGWAASTQVPRCFSLNAVACITSTDCNFIYR